MNPLTIWAVILIILAVVCAVVVLSMWVEELDDSDELWP